MRRDRVVATRRRLFCQSGGNRVESDCAAGVELSFVSTFQSHCWDLRQIWVHLWGLCLSASDVWSDRGCVSVCERVRVCVCERGSCRAGGMTMSASALQAEERMILYQYYLRKHSFGGLWQQQFNTEFPKREIILIFLKGVHVNHWQNQITWSIT